MNAGRDVERVIADWLIDEAPARAPDRILDEAGIHLDRTKQRRFAAIWREPMIISTGRLVAAAAVVLAAVFAAGWLGRTTAAVGAAGPPVASARPSAAPTLESFRAARDVICNAASANLNPLKSRFLGIWDGSITQTQRAAWVAGLQTFAHGYDQLATDLDGLAPPPDLAAAHAANVAGLRDLTSLIQSTAADLAAGRDAQAEGVDQSTNPLGARATAWETSLQLAHCP